MGDTLTISSQGYTDLPVGKVATIVTYLEMRPVRRHRSRAPRPDLSLARLRGDDVARYLSLFRVFGERWLWWSRLALPQDRLRELLADPQVEAYALVRGGVDAGLLELDFSDADAAELAFLALIEPLIGSGVGSWMMAYATERACARGAPRLFVHTCTFDHAGALGFYRRHGFMPYKIAVEINDDPRRSGLLSRVAAPHVPLIEPA